MTTKTKTKLPTVRELREKGYRVRVDHVRHIDGELEVEPRGGVTVVQITTPQGLTLVGESFCSKKDNYNKKLGVKIAMSRALMPTSEKERRFKKKEEQAKLEEGLAIGKALGLF